MTSFQLASGRARTSARTVHAHPLRFIALLAATWLGFAWLQADALRGGPVLVTLFATGSALVSMLFLDAMGYFSSLRVLPRQSDLLIIAAAIPAAGLLADAVIFAIFREFLVPLENVVLYAPMVATALFGSNFLWERRRLRNGTRRRIVLELLPSERSSLIAEFAEAGMDQFVEFLPPSALRDCFLGNFHGEIDQVVISRGAVREIRDSEHLLRAHLHGIPIVDRRELIENISGRIHLRDSDTWSYIQAATQQTALLLGYSHLKVVIEPILAFILLILLLPLMIVVAVVIRWTSPGPVFYRQARAGYLGKHFNLIKFRSMTVDSEANGPQWAKDGDSRVTRIGKFLRATRIDELPQLWNVIRGEMSFIGPRPERPEFYRTLDAEIPIFSMRTIIRPGITGWAQVCAGYAASVEESKTKLEFDLYYISHVSFRLDMIVLIRTLTVAFMASERAKAQPANAAGTRKLGA